MAEIIRVFHSLQQANSTLFNAADHSLKKREGIRTAHQVILFLLCEEDGLASAEMAKRTGLSKSRLTGLADTLVEKSLVRRERGEVDGSQNFLFIEAVGRAIIERTKTWVNNLNASLLENFDR